MLLPIAISNSSVYSSQVRFISYHTNSLTGHDGSYDLVGANVCCVHHEPVFHNLFAFFPSPILKLYIDNADCHFMSRSYTIIKREGIWLSAAFDFGFNTKGVRKLFKLGLLFWQNNKLRDYVNYIPSSAVWVPHATTTWPWQCTPLKNCCVITKSSGRSAWIRARKLKASVMGRDGPRVCCRKKALPSQLPAVCAGRAPACSTVCVQLCTVGQQWLGNCTVSCPSVASQQN